MTRFVCDDREYASSFYLKDVNTTDRIRNIMYWAWIDLPLSPQSKPESHCHARPQNYPYRCFPGKPTLLWRYILPIRQSHVHQLRQYHRPYTTNTGLQGWGESTPFAANFIASHAAGVGAGIAEVAPHLIGLDPRRTDRINDVMDAVLMGHEHTKTPIDVACWGLFGKAVQMPVCELLNGRTEHNLPVISSIHTGSPEDMRERVISRRLRGYEGHSIKLAADDPVADAARIVACLANSHPHELFIVDANGGLTVETAPRTLRLLPHGLDSILEAPCATYRECASLHS